MKFFLIATAALLISSPAFADIKLKDVHAFETSQGMKNGAALMQIENTGDKQDKLISASSPVATEVEIHEMKEEKGVMKMREVGAITIKPGETVELSPHGYHIMLLGLKEPLAQGKSFPMTLKFLNGAEITTAVRVQKRAVKTVEPSNHEDHSGHAGHTGH